jgi:predicted nucleic acid-binding protein
MLVHYHKSQLKLCVSSRKKQTELMKVLDTNFLIDFNGGTRKSKVKMESIQNEPLIASQVTVIELLAGTLLAGEFVAREINIITKTLDLLNIAPIDDSITRWAALVYAYLHATHKMINHFDIIIAGTALAFNVPLITRDRDFERLVDRFGLQLESWL